MIIFNNKGRASNFIKRGSDNRVFDIRSSMHIEELYDWLLHNEGLPEGTTVAQYNTREEPSIFEMPVEENGNAAQTVLNRTVRQYTDSTVSDNYGHTNFVDVMESMKAAKKDFANNADYYRLEAKFNGMVMPSAADGDAGHMVFGTFTEVDFNRDELLRHLADSLSVYPSLYADTEMPLEEKQTLGKDANRLRWTFKGEGYTTVPTIEQVKAFGSWNKYEQSLITDSLYCPTDLLRNGVIIKTEHPDYALTPDNLLGLSSRMSARQELLDECKTLFEQKFRQAPRVLKEYVEAQMLAGITSAQEIVDNFSKETLASLRPVAKLGSEVLFAFVPHCNFSQFKPDQISYLATHIKYHDVRELLRNGFGEWFAKHRNERLADLTELLQANSVDEIGSWDMNKTARQIIEEIKYRAGKIDCEKYERAYHYSFADNDVAIKGKNLIVRDGEFKMYFLAKDDYRNFTVGYDTYCCQHWGGAGGSCVYKLTTDPFAACVVIERAGRIMGQAFVWTDEINDTFVFDNIEFANDRVVADYADLISSFSKEIPYKNVHMGTGYVAGQYTSWGQCLSNLCAGNPAVMPTTLDGRTHIYTDYHSSARVFKHDGMMFIHQGHARVEWGPEEPSRWDALRDSGAKVLLNEYTMTVAERLAFSGRGFGEIEEARQLALLLKNPILVDSMDSVPESWQQSLLDRDVHPKTLQYIKNPIQAVKDKILETIPSKVVDWPDATRDDWKTALCKAPELTEKCPFELDSDIANAVYEAKGEVALSYIPLGLIEPSRVAHVIERSPRTILSLDEPAEELVITAVTQQPLLLSALPYVTDRVGRAAIEAMPASIIYWPDAPHSACEDAIRAQPTLIRNLAHRFSDLRELAIRTDPDAVWSVPGATEEEFVLAERVKLEQAGVAVDAGEPTPPPLDALDGMDSMLDSLAGMSGIAE